MVSSSLPKHFLRLFDYIHVIGPQDCCQCHSQHITHAQRFVANRNCPFKSWGWPKREHGASTQRASPRSPSLRMILVGHMKPCCCQQRAGLIQNGFPLEPERDAGRVVVGTLVVVIDVWLPLPSIVRQSCMCGMHLNACSLQAVTTLTAAHMLDHFVFLVNVRVTIPNFVNAT